LTARRVALAGLIACAAGLAWLLFIGLPRWYAPPGPINAVTDQRPAPESTGRKIKARLFYIAETGTVLTGVERDVPFGDTPIEQAKAIVNAQLEAPTEPLVSAVPTGTTLRSLFVTSQGEAYVDLSTELSQAHPGGSLNEMLTIYTLVNALTVNMPAVSAVQVLIDGKEVETLAGHVDLRRPLEQNMSWVQESLVDSR
jgi:spore germination protein GerM